MKKYNCFNRNYLNKNLQEMMKIKNAIEKSKDPNLDKYELVQENINEIKVFLENGDLNTLYDIVENQSIKDRMKHNREYFEDESNSLPIIRDFLNTYSEAVDKLNLEDFEVEILKDTAYTHKRMLEIVHDFYMSIPDKEIKDIFNKLYKNRINNVRFKKLEASYCGTTGLDNKKYISIDNTVNFRCLSNLAHEYGHAIHDEYLGTPAMYNFDQYTELPSIFFQLLMLEYIANNYPNNYKKAKLESIGMLIQMDIYANNLEVLRKSKDLDFKNEEEAYKYYLNYVDEYEAEMALKMDGYLFHDYLIPYIIDIELLWEYRKDPEKGIYLLKKLIKNYENDYIEETKSIGLNLNGHVYKYIKHLTKN